MSFWKDRLARKIIFEDCYTWKKLLDIQREFPSLRVKTIDVKGNVAVIQLSEHGEWMKPIEWANNHIHAIEARYSEQRARLIDIGCDPSVLCMDDCDAIRELKESEEGDPTELERVTARLKRADRNYCHAMDILCEKPRSVEMTLEDNKAILSWKNGKHKYYF